MKERKHTCTAALMAASNPMGSALKAIADTPEGG